MENNSIVDTVGKIGSESTGKPVFGSKPPECKPAGPRYDNTFVLNMSSAAKIDLIVDRVKSLGLKRVPPGTFANAEWFRHMIDPCSEAAGAYDSGAQNVNPILPTNQSTCSQFDEDHAAHFTTHESSDGSSVSQVLSNGGIVIGEQESATVPPFLPFSSVLITGTAGAGKTSSVQALAANLDCVVTGSTVVSAQALSQSLNRTRSSQVKTIFRSFGFNSKHIALADGAHSRKRDRVLFKKKQNEDDLEPIVLQQRRDLSVYWPVIADIASRALTSSSNKPARDISDLCRTNIIVIDECGILLRHMLHVVVFFFYFYNALYDTALYQKGCVPCIVCVGSPTQSEALESRFDHRKQNKNVQRGLDVLSALISDPVLTQYCSIALGNDDQKTDRGNWIMFINNKRCVDPEFGNLLKHIEFGLPLKEEHIRYMDRFVRPPGHIRDPAFALDTTRLFISHAEVKKYFLALHDRVRTHDRKLLFEVPVYCVVENAVFEHYCQLTEGVAEFCRVPGGKPRPEIWFKKNLHRIGNYSQFTDHNLSDEVEVEDIWDQKGKEAYEEFGSVDQSINNNGFPTKTLLTTKVSFVKDSTIGVTSKTRACVIGYTGTFDEFAEILQKDIFIERTPCEQAIYAYSLISGLLYSAMYLFYSSPFATAQILAEFSNIKLPEIPILERKGDDNVFESADVFRNENDEYRKPTQCFEEEFDSSTDPIKKNDGESDLFTVGDCTDYDFEYDDEEISMIFDECDSAVIDEDHEAAQPGGKAVADVARRTAPAPPSSPEKAAFNYIDDSELFMDGISDTEAACALDVYTDQFFLRYKLPPPVNQISFEEVVQIYTVFRSVFLARYRIMQEKTQGRFGQSKLVAYNRRNVFRRETCEIVSHNGSFTGMLMYISPSASYILEGYTKADVFLLDMDRNKIHESIGEKGLPRLLVRDSYGFILALEFNVSKFVDNVDGKSLHLCTIVDYGVTSRMAMTIAKSQGLSLESVAIDFGNNPKNLKLSQIYVGISRVVNPDKLITNINPLRVAYETNTFITPFIRRALQNKKTTLIF